MHRALRASYETKHIKSLQAHGSHTRHIIKAWLLDPFEAMAALARW